MRILLPRGYSTAQPASAGVRPNWENPLTRGLKALVTPLGESAHGGPLSIVAGAGSPFSTGQSGRKLVANDALVLQAPGIPYVPPPFTCIFVGLPETGTPGRSWISFGGSGTGFGWAFGSTSGSTADMRLTFGNVADYNSLASGGFDLVNVAAYAFTVSATTATAYRNGIQVGSTPVGTAGAATQPLTLLGGAGGAGFVNLATNADLYGLALWDRVLSDAEIRALTSTLPSFWQLFAQPAQLIPAFAPSGASIVSGAASSTSTATDIAVGAAKATADFTSTGTATDIGVGNAIAAAAFSSTATATATGDARSTASAAATSTGVATDIAVGAALSSGAMTSASVLTATGSPPGAIIVAGDGSSVSASTAAATGASTASSAATSASVATPIAVGASLVAGAGRSVSTGTFTASSVTSSARRVYGGRKRDEQRRRQNNQLMQLVAIAVPLISREGSWAH